MQARRAYTTRHEFPHGMRLSIAFWVVPILIIGCAFTVAFVLMRDEMLTSKMQSEWMTWYDARISFAPEPGSNPAIRFPAAGPYNQRLGYSYMPFFFKSLEADNYTVAEQMRASPMYNRLLDEKYYPIYHPKTVAGLTLYDREGKSIYAAGYPNHVFADFDSIPPLLVNTLTYIENRELLKDTPPTHNPVIEWDRFLYAAFGHLFHIVIPGINAGGGSTLATQIEKFRFSPGGQTTSGNEKLRQIISASLRAYLDGADTRLTRERILLDYLNSTPLGARPGFGEINSIGDGLWAWYGIDLNDAITALNLPETDSVSLHAKAQVYRAVLGLILAQRRPSYYLTPDHAALDDLADAALDRLAEGGVISATLCNAAKAASFRFLAEAPSAPQPPFVEQKAANALRSHLLGMLGLKKLYEVDRLDLSARATLDQATQQKTVAFLQNMGNHNFLESIGLYGFRLLDPENDPAKIKWSVVLYERDANSNKLRVQADNIEQPFDMNEGMKLDLGSTAKLRTLVTYLEIMGELYRRYAGLSPADLQDLSSDPPDALTQWATEWLTTHPGATLNEMLAASMNRTYSGNPQEVFFTGGGVHQFANFEHSEDGRMMDLHEAFRESVNLVFVRVMRDIVNYTIAQGAQTKEELLDEPDDPARQNYLERFAEQEGGAYLNRYIGDYAGLSPNDVLERLLTHAHKGTTARTLLFRSVRPQATFDDYAAFMKKHPSGDDADAAYLARLYQENPVERYNLSDRAYVAGVNPLELWLAGYLQANPRASRRDIADASHEVRTESYAWLFHSNLKHAQDSRIRIMLEEDAFARIQKRWARLGYPFDKLVPSLATAIGSSADRPGALAELVGIILNDGVKLPTVRFDSLLFGKDTPYQTLLAYNSDTDKQQVLDPAITHVMKDVMAEVVDNGTAKRVKGVYKDVLGGLLPVGGKTGTGDQRYDEFSSGGQLVSSRVMNRTGTFVFYIGDRFFGTITAHVAGEDAADYKFTSALSAQMLRALAPIFQPLINAPATTAQNTSAPASAN